MKTHLSRILILASLAILTTGCPEKPVKIGVVLPLTGEYHVYGEGNRRGVELALEEIRTNGYPLELEHAIVDTGSDPEKARELLEQQFEEGAFVAVGGTVSSEAKAMVAVADEYERVLLSPSATSPDLTGISRNLFRIAPSDLTEGNKMADFAVRALEVKTVVVIAEQEDYARGIQGAFASAFERLGGEVLEVIDLPPHTTDLGGLMGRVMTLSPDAVYLAAYEAGIAAMILELRRLGFEGRILTTHAFSSPSAIARVGEAAVGVVLTQTVFEPDSDHAHVKKFVDAYRERFGSEPDLFAAEGYDAMRVLALALEKRHDFANELGRGLREEVKDFPGVTGSIQFDERNEVKKFPRVYLVSKELLLVDYSRKLEEIERRRREKQEEIKRRLQELQAQAERVGNGGP